MTLKQIVVFPRAGKWIEIDVLEIALSIMDVFPRAGKWIEMKLIKMGLNYAEVFPRAGKWIEIEWRCCDLCFFWSSLVRGSGLKWTASAESSFSKIVFPRAGKWIEISDF